MRLCAELVFRGPLSQGSNADIYTFRGLSRSRRKSCQACAESKIKCDLQQPCTKCKTRGRDCIYVSGHNVASGSQIGQAETRESDDLERELLAMLKAHPVPGASARPISAVPLPQNFLDMMCGTGIRRDKSPEVGPPTWGYPSYEPESSVNFSIDSRSMFARVDGTASPLQDGGRDMPANQMFGDLLGSFFAPTQQVSFNSPNPFGMSQAVTSIDSDKGGTDSLFDSTFPLSTVPVDPPQPQDSMFVELHDSPSLSTTFSSPGPSNALSPASTSSSARSGPSSRDLQTYLSLFYSAYLPNMPIIHAPTFDIEGKSPLLVAAMQACGALYVKTRTAMDFIDSTLGRARDELVVELARESVEWEHQIQLALAVDLFQTLGLFHNNPEQRAFSNIYHGMLAMVRRAPTPAA